MRRLLVCFAYFFQGQRILPWISACGAAMIALTLFVPGRMGSALAALGAIFLAGFPILIGGVAYRQLISNRRVALVPDIRVFATVALFLLALAGAGLAGYVALNVISRPDPWRVAQLAFATISLYLVISQWAITHRAAALLFFVVPIIVLRFAVTRPAGEWEQVFVPWAWVTLAGLAWLWLAVAVRGKGLPRCMAGDSVSRGSRRLPGGHAAAPRVATALGTLLRASGDGWRNRMAVALMIVLLFPVIMGITFAFMEPPQRSPVTGRYWDLLLNISLVGCCAFPAMLFADWPVRLRLVWLRISGDRLDLWRDLERMLFRDLLLVAAIAVGVAAGFHFWSDASRQLLYLYTAAAVLACLAGGYLGFLSRISGWHSGTQGLQFSVLIFVYLVCQAWFRSNAPLFASFWLLPLLAVVALVARALARSRFLRMDWCKIRPLRFPRRVA